MKRNLKCLGLAFVVVAAMSVVMSSAAQALPTFTCSQYPCTATGEGKAAQLTTPGGSVNCNVHAVIEKYRTTTGEGFPSPGSSTVTVTTKYTECTAFGFLGATVSTNGCDWELHATETLEFSGHYAHHLYEHCPGGGTTTVVAGTCEITVGTQSLTDVTTINITSGVNEGKLTLVLRLQNVTINVVKDGFGCPFSGTGHKTGEYHGHMILARVGGGTVSVSGS